MLHQDLQRRLRSKPFEPFRMFLTDGTTCDIRHPEVLLVGKRTAILGLTSDPQDTAFDQAVDIDLFHIICVEPPPAAAANNP
jgi:hypothetical protein